MLYTYKLNPFCWAFFELLIEFNNIFRGLQWLIEHVHHYLNICCGGGSCVLAFKSALDLPEPTVNIL